MKISITTTKLWDDNTHLVFKRLYNLHNYINFSFIEGVNKPNCEAVAKQFKMYCIGSLFYKDHDFEDQVMEACELADKCDVKYLMLGSGRYRPAIEQETTYTELQSIAHRHYKELLFEPIDMKEVKQHIYYFEDNLPNDVHAVVDGDFWSSIVKQNYKLLTSKVNNL